MPEYGSAYRFEGMAEKARNEVRGEEAFGSAGLKQMRLALRLASRVRVADIVNEVRFNWRL